MNLERPAREELRLPEAGAALLALKWLAEYPATTRRAYGRDLRYWLWNLEARGVPVFEATRADVALWASELAAAGKASSTIARRLAAVSSYYGYLVDEELVAVKPVSRVRRPRATHNPTPALTRSELSGLLAAAGRAGARDHALVCVFAFTGLRVSEVCRANVGDLTSEQGSRVLRTIGKGGKHNRSALNPRTVAALDRYLEERVHADMTSPQPPADGRFPGPREPLFLTGSGGRLNRNAATRAITRLARAAGVEHRLSPHGMRATFITISLEAGVALADVQDAANHADPRQTRAYDRNRYRIERHPAHKFGAYMAEVSSE